MQRDSHKSNFSLPSMHNKDAFPLLKEQDTSFELVLFQRVIVQRRDGQVV